MPTILISFSPFRFLILNDTARRSIVSPPLPFTNTIKASYLILLPFETCARNTSSKNVTPQSSLRRDRPFSLYLHSPYRPLRKPYHCPGFLSSILQSSHCLRRARIGSNTLLRPRTRTYFFLPNHEPKGHLASSHTIADWNLSSCCQETEAEKQQFELQSVHQILRLRRRDPYPSIRHIIRFPTRYLCRSNKRL